MCYVCKITRPYIGVARRVRYQGLLGKPQCEAPPRRKKTHLPLLQPKVRLVCVHAFQTIPNTPLYCCYLGTASSVAIQVFR
jgi:hypothetical protein